MRPEEILGHVRKTPFKPFRVFLTDGPSHPVEHPELIVVGRTTVFIAFRSRPGRLPERSVWFDPFHVTRVEPLNGSHARQGRRRKR